MTNQTINLISLLIFQAKNLDKADPVKDSMKSKRIIDNMNEFAQTNMDKGVTDSAPEAPV